MSDKQFILTIDQGTTSTRAILFDQAGSIRAVVQQPITQYFPASGWVNHDANEIWQSVRSCVTQVMAQNGLRLANVVAVGITNQRETTIVWDRVSGEPLAPAIVWQSRQSTPLVNAIVERGMGNAFTSSPVSFRMPISPLPNSRCFWTSIPKSGVRQKRARLCLERSIAGWFTSFLAEPSM